MKAQRVQTIETKEQERPLGPVKRKQVGLLGGNFNPVHLAHLIIADQVGQALGLDKVCLMPSYFSPHIDAKKTIDASHRLKMLELAIEDNSLLQVETIELQRQGKSYTYDTMVALIDQNPDTDYYFIIGGDMVDYLPTWYRIEDLLQLVQFVGVKRPGYPVETNYPVIWVDVPWFDLSSTMIRNKIQAGCSVNYFLPNPVIQYIKEEGLYLETK